MAEFNIDYNLKVDGKKVELTINSIDERLRFNEATAPANVFGTNYKVNGTDGNLFLFGSTSRGPEIGIGNYEKAIEGEKLPANTGPLFYSIVLHGADRTLDDVKPTFEFNTADEANKFKENFDTTISIFIDRLNGIGVEEPAVKSEPGVEEVDEYEFEDYDMEDDDMDIYEEENDLDI
jgi:hypothetical protein